MLIVEHRINTAAALARVPRAHGVEVDLRCDGGRLVLRHDPAGPAEPFDAWLDDFDHALLIANVKEEGLEDLVRDAMGDRPFFFLDQSAPFLIRGALAGERRSAVRVSDWEAPSLAHKLAGRVQWIWLDVFQSGPPVDDSVVRDLRAVGYQICLVSPELHALERAPEIPALRAWAEPLGIEAVCTKRPADWS